MKSIQRGSSFASAEPDSGGGDNSRIILVESKEKPSPERYGKGLADVDKTMVTGA